MGTDESASTRTIDAIALLELPTIASGLSDVQIRGAACVWCAIPVSGATGVDLGTQSGSFAGAVTYWFPRGCRACVRKAACLVYDAHPRDCEQCVDDPTVCTVRRALRRLALEGRR